MRLLVIGAVLVAGLHLASAKPQDGGTSPKGSQGSSFYYAGSPGKPVPSERKYAVAAEKPVEVVHSRSRRSTTYQYHYVSQPRIPQWTYIRVFQRLPDPEPEPTPEPLPPLPAVEERKHLSIEESHSRHDEEEHEEEHEEHETVHHLEEYEMVEGRRQRRPGAGGVGKPGRRGRPAAGKATSSQGKSKAPSKNRRKPKKNRQPKRPVAGAGADVLPGAPVRPGWPVLPPRPAPVHHLVGRPHPPLTYYDPRGLLHMVLETSPFERLDLVQAGLYPSGRPKWSVVVDGRRPSYVPVGPGYGSLSFLPVLGRGGHEDWVFVAKDPRGLTHDVHFKNSGGHLPLITATSPLGVKTKGVIGYDETGEILIPMHYEHGHLVVEQLVHPVVHIL